MFDTTTTPVYRARLKAELAFFDQVNSADAGSIWLYVVKDHQDRKDVFRRLLDWDFAGAYGITNGNVFIFKNHANLYVLPEAHVEGLRGTRLSGALLPKSPGLAQAQRQIILPGLIDAEGEVVWYE